MFHKGAKGFSVFHDSEYFKEKKYFNKDSELADKWIRLVKEQAQYYDVTKRYETIRTLGKGKFSSVYLCRA